MVRVTCSSGYPSLSQPLVCLRWGFLIPLIALSLDGVFRGCFAVDFSPFLPFRWLVLPCYNARYDFLPVQVSLYTIPKGEFHISHDASLHTILSNFRTHVMLSVQQGRDSWTAVESDLLSFADKTFFTFALSIYLRFSFYYSKYISC